MNNATLRRNTLFPLLLIAASLVLYSSSALAQSGEERFKTACAACHTIGEGKRVGPDLKGVTERRTEEWLLKFIKSSQSVIKSGDPVAVALFNEYNKTPMPDQPLDDGQIKEILAFISGGASSGGGSDTVVEATPEAIALGGNIFQGMKRLKNGGPACNSCHHVKNDAVIGGGVLAKELTTVFSAMGAPGVQAVLGSPPFPVMAAAYKDNPITEDEAVALIAFLQDADKHHAFQQPRDYGVNLVASGSAGFVLLMVLYGLLWRRRKKLPVNHAIFERQVRTEDA